MKIIFYIIELEKSNECDDNSVDEKHLNDTKTTKNRLERKAGEEEKKNYENIIK